MPQLTNEELRFEIQKQMGDCVVGIDATETTLVVAARWPDGMAHAITCEDRSSDGWQSTFIATAVSKLTAWREIKLLEMPHPGARCWLSLPFRLPAGA